MEDPELDAIILAMDKDREGGRDQALAVSLADAYVAAHPDTFTFLQGMNIEACVGLVDVFRGAGDLRSLFLVETWLLHCYPPQNIGGEYVAQVRVTE
ncbi:hypothetical protein [Mycobacterium sp. 48b]|uniref:hypothetical protein n=1 Tax=Mycobacterium sp. 48b TaxID=3400426 RepID=UPI003AAFB914